MTKPLVVSICGPAGAGKSQVAKAVAAALGDERASRVPADMFLVPRAKGESLDQYFARPLQWDWALLAARLAVPPGTVVTAPDVDFTEFRRASDEGGYAVVMRPVMLVDAMAPYPESDRVVQLEAPGAVRRARIAERDRRWQSAVLARWAHLEMTWVAAQERLTPDRVVDADREFGDVVWEVTEAIAGWERGD